MRLIILLIFCMLCLTHAARAATQTLDYEVYAGGINALSAQLTLDTAAVGAYHIKLQAQTKGMLGRLAPWYGTFMTDGVVLQDGRVRPALYQSNTVWHKKNETKQFRYKPDGGFVGFEVNDANKNGETKNVTPSDFDPKLARGTSDSLSATLQMMRHVAGGGACAGSSDVFDGLRRFKLVFHAEGTDTIAPSGLNVYSGPAQRCTVEVVPDGGKWHEKPRGWLSIQEQGRQQGSLPTLWLAQIKGTGPAVPVRVRIVTSYGVLFMQLAKIE